MSDEASTSNDRRSGNAQAQSGDALVDWAGVDPIANDVAVRLSDNEIMALLANVVEGEIIPRLMMAHQTYGSEIETGDDRDALSEAMVEQFVQLTLSGEVDDLEDKVEDLVSQGYAIEQLYLDLLAPAARVLGVYWEQDRSSFTEVTIGLGRLQTLLYRMSAKQKGVVDTKALIPIGLFITPHNSQHSFGIRMVDDLFRRAGWNTVCEPAVTVEEAIDLVKTMKFDLVGVGISAGDQIDMSKDIIAAIRANSRNRQIKIMVGGSRVVDDLALCDALGADLSARDAREAVTIAQNIVYDHSLRH